jgi:hypothetical protein
MCKYTWEGGWWWSISTPRFIITSDFVITSSLTILCWKMIVLHFLIKVVNHLCDWFVGFAHREEIMHVQDLDLGIKFWCIHWRMWKWQVFTKWKFSNGCNFSCLGGCNPKYIRFLSWKLNVVFFDNHCH